MLCTVSTVKDSRANVERFVARNLRSGADHMLVFLESDEDDTYGFLQGHPHVTPVRAMDTYWAGGRPERLFQRQLVNANLANCLVSAFPAVGWLVHLDADECLEIDKERFDTLDSTVRCVRLAVLEAVSTEHGGMDPKYFKKKLKPEELTELAQLGVIEAPHNRHYLKGYLIGKAAVRPGLDLAMGVHRATKATGESIFHFRGPGFRILHYEAVSPADFASKWVTRLASGPTYREERSRVADAVAAVLADHATDEHEKQAQLLEVYRRYVEDPVDLLLDRGLLVKPRKKRHRYVPSPFSEADLHALEELSRRLIRIDKRHFAQQRPPDASVRLMAEISYGLGWRRRSLAKRIDDAVERGMHLQRA